MTTTTQAPATGADLMRQFVPNCPFAVRTGVEIVSIEPGEARLRLGFREEVTTIGTTVHGGAIATLVDTAAAVAAWSGAELPETLRGVTVGLTVNYLAPADGEDVEARASVLRQGRRLATVAVDVHTVSQRHVATALVTYQIG
jgi:uncharacterized protein (TIGR00369 family)